MDGGHQDYYMPMHTWGLITLRTYTFANQEEWGGGASCTIRIMQYSLKMYKENTNCVYDKYIDIQL